MDDKWIASASLARPARFVHSIVSNTQCSPQSTGPAGAHVVKQRIWRGIGTQSKVISFHILAFSAHMCVRQRRFRTCVPTYMLTRTFDSSRTETKPIHLSCGEHIGAARSSITCTALSICPTHIRHACHWINRHRTGTHYVGAHDSRLSAIVRSLTQKLHGPDDASY